MLIIDALRTRASARPERAGIISLLFCCLLTSGWLAGAVPAAGQPAESDEAAPRQDAMGRDTPRSAVVGYLTACRAGDYARAAAFLDLTDSAGEDDPEQAQSLARRLKVALDRALWIDPGQLSGAPEGATDDALPADRERIGTIAVAGGEVSIALSRRASEQGVPIWLFSASTVAQIERLYDEFGYGPLGETLPPYFFQLRFLELQLWQWVGMILLVPLAGVVGYLLATLIVRLGRGIVGRTKAEWDDVLLENSAGPIRVVITVLIFYLGSKPLALSVPAQDSVAVISKIAAILSITWLATRLVDISAEILRQRLQPRDVVAANTLVPMGRRTMKVFVVLIAGVSLLQNVGFNVTGLVAGLGVGGLAFALAAQKTVENLFGGVSVIADRPVKVGDFCRVGEHIGTVEDIGLRSTRIRTLDRTVVTIPNAEFATARIDNFAVRDRMRLYTMLQIGYDTTPDQVRYILIELRKMLVAHPKTLPEPRRVRFVNFGAHSLDLEIFVYIDTKDYNEFLAIREDIFLRIMDIIAGAGAYFAYPSQTLYLGKDAGRDLEKSRAAEETLKSWRDASEMFMPDLSAETISQLEDTLDYPPCGSPNQRDPRGASPQKPRGR